MSKKGLTIGDVIKGKGNKNNDGKKTRPTKNNKVDESEPTMLNSNGNSKKSIFKNNYSTDPIQKPNYYLINGVAPTNQLFTKHMKNLVQPHTTSFDYLTKEILPNIGKHIFSFSTPKFYINRKLHSIGIGKLEEYIKNNRGDNILLLDDRVSNKRGKDEEEDSDDEEETSGKSKRKEKKSEFRVEDEIKLQDEPYLKFTYKIESIQVGSPMLTDDVTTRRLYPKDARLMRTNYGSTAMATISVTEEFTGTRDDIVVKLTDSFPIMINSELCSLHGTSPEERARLGEEEHEPGGYFIANGSECVYRMLIQQRSNYPLAITRPSYASLREGYTDKGILIRCKHPCTMITRLNSLHYRKDGVMFLRFGNPTPIYANIILILKALKNISDRDLFLLITAGTKNKATLDKVLEGISDFRNTFRETVQTKEDAIIKLAQLYTSREIITDRYKLLEIGTEVLRHQIIPMYETPETDEILLTEEECQKRFDFLVYSMQKLIKFVDGEIIEENIDDLDNEELLTIGELLANIIPHYVYSALLKTHLTAYKLLHERMQKQKEQTFTVDICKDTVIRMLKSKMDAIISKDFKLNYQRFFSVGSVVPSSPYRIEISQFKALMIKLERINFLRVISNFRSTHRGDAFSESNDTSMRRLNPTFWGFICPVHSPDGHLCGLVNHLSHTAEVVTYPAKKEELLAIKNTLIKIGLVTSNNTNSISIEEEAPVLIDGEIIGKVPISQLSKIAEQLRYCKVSGEYNLPKNMEIACLEGKRDNMLVPYLPELLISTGVGRLVRPVLYLPTKQEEWIGPAEQTFLNIACLESDIKPTTTHKEIDPTNVMSFVANLTPFCNFNQSPRCIYQCQMAKQSMAATFHSLETRNDSKLYDIKITQKPLTRTKHQIDLPFDEYNNGANAIVAVISYTGFDMEDAMIVNKSTIERGFMHGSIYKTEDIGEKDQIILTNRKFYKSGSKDDYLEKEYEELDIDGLPEKGMILEEGTIYACGWDDTKKRFIPFKWKETDGAIVQNVKVTTDKDGIARKANITIRIDRNPIIGDKFSSRHGQKGVLSIMWPQEDMPFSESGIVPDVIINPHAFPSRMTIGMLVESMSSKAGALHGYFPDATPFTFDEQHTAVDYFGEQLRKAGYNYYGNEVLYSGTLGIELKADIFMGVVYYQRLRHMVSDKFQFRTPESGKVNMLTRQPIKGRSKGGGVRMGEMERDALIAYGAASVLKDRFFDCTDSSTTIVCSCCNMTNTVVSLDFGETNSPLICSYCRTGEHLRSVYIPYTTKYLSSELAAVGINMKLKVIEGTNL